MPDINQLSRQKSIPTRVRLYDHLRERTLSARSSQSLSSRSSRSSVDEEVVMEKPRQYQDMEQEDIPLVEKLVEPGIVVLNETGDVQYSVRPGGLMSSEVREDPVLYNIAFHNRWKTGQKLLLQESSSVGKYVEVVECPQKDPQRRPFMLCRSDGSTERRCLRQ